MYTVVLCPKCQFVWIVEDTPNRTECMRCGKSHQFSNLRHLEQAPSQEEARKYRAAVTADLADMTDEFETAVKDGGIFEEADSRIDIEEELDERGLDLSQVEEAGDVSKKSSRSEVEIIEDAIDDLGSPTMEAVVERAGEDGVAREKAEKVIERLRKRGELVESGGTLRRI